MFHFCLSMDSFVVQLFSWVLLFATPWTAAHQPSLPSLFPRVSSNWCPLIQWCYPTISFSVPPFSSCPRSFPSSGSFPISQFFASDGQSIRASASASVPHGLQPARFLCLWNSPGKKTGVGCHSLLQRFFPTQGLNPSFLHFRQILYCLSHQGSILAHIT